MTIFTGIIIGMLVYSLILTIVLLYEDNSSYFDVETLDIIVAGPFAWLLMLVFAIIRVFYKKFHKEKKREYKQKDAKYIQKVVKKIVNNYKNSSYSSDYIDFNKSQDFGGSGVEGYYAIVVSHWLNEKLNKRFYSLMNHQKEETVEELMKYFHRVTEDEMKKDDCDSYFISIQKTKEFYKLNK